MRITRTLLLGTALLAGCARVRPGTTDDTQYLRLGDLEISANVERDLWDVYGAVDLMNTSQDTVRLQYVGYCGIAILMYQGEAPDPRWDSTEYWTRQRGECPQGLVDMHIPPRTLARVVAPAVNAQRILGDSLPAGSYATAMRLRLVQPHDTLLVLPSGRIELDRPEPGDGKVATRTAP